MTVTVIPDTTNNYAEYQISTSITGNGKSNDLAQGVDYVYVQFDTATVLPSSISASLISINGLPLNSAPSIADQTISMLVPVNIENDGNPEINIVISASAQIKNPGDSGSHSLNIWTTGSTDDDPPGVGTYTLYLSSSTVSVASVTPNPSVADENASYNVSFNVGNGGFLTANVSSIVLAFDPDTDVPTGSLSGVTVNSTAATAVASNDTVVITSPVNIDNDGSVQVVFASGVGLKNPVTAGDYTLSVSTSSEPTFVSSESYTISPFGQLSISAISSKPDTVNQSGEFAFDLRTGSSGALTGESDGLTVIFEPNTYLPGTISSGNISIFTNGNGYNAYSVSVSNSDPTDEDTVAIVTPYDIPASSDVTITFNSSAGYQNPSVAGNYVIKLYTSVETTPVTSNSFSIFATTTQVSEALVTPVSSDPNINSSYEMEFTLGSKGRLKAGTSTVTVSFPSGYTVSGTAANYDSTYITIAGGSPIKIDETSQIAANATNRTVQITVPDNALTENNNSINLFIGGEVGNTTITNPTTEGTYQVAVNTSVETGTVQSTSFSIGGTSIDILSIARNDSTVNSTSSYDFYLDIQTQLNKNNNDYIKIVFPSGTILPETINIANMSIDGDQPKTPINVNTETRTITARVSTSINPDNPQYDPFHVIISEAAGIINPSVPSSTFYRYTLYTSKDTKLVTSDYYQMVSSDSSVSNVSASASPAVVNISNVAYTINFTTSSIGRLIGGAAAGSSTITVDFDNATIVPATITAGNVEVNSVPCQNVTVDASGAGGIVTVTVPNGVTIENGTSATVLFKSTLGFANADISDGTYTVQVKTSSDGINGSGNYTLTASQDLFITSVTPSPSLQNASAGYSVAFTLGSGGALSIGDTIRIIFPSNTYLPQTMSTSDVLVNGSNPPSAPLISGQTLKIRAPEILSGLDPVTVLINQVAGVLNPTTIQSYTLQVTTDAEAGPFTSPSYSITKTSTTVSSINVIPNPITPSVAADYTVDYTTGANGRLIAGTSTITVTFNTQTTVSTTPGDYGSTYITVDGSQTQIPTTDITIVGKAITMVVPSGVSVDNGDAVSILISGTNPITNPAAGSYTLQVKTSVETSDITSNSYTISNAQAVTGIVNSLSVSTVNAESAYEIRFRAAVRIAAGGTITVTFPSNTLVPSSMPNATVTIAHDASNPDADTPNNASAVSTNSSTRVVTITIPEVIADVAPDSVIVRFLSSAGLENPSLDGSKTLQVKTSSQNVNGTSAAYTLNTTTTTILNFSIDVTPRESSVSGQYTYSFTTGSLGRLVAGTSTIHLFIPDDATFTQGVPALSKVTVNGTAAQALTLNTGAGTDPDELIVTVPSSVTIGNSTNVTVIIDETAGLQNASTTTALNYSAFTSVETSGQGGDFSLPVELSSFTAESESGVNYLEWVTESELENAYWMIERKKISKEEYNAIQKGEVDVSMVGKPFEVLDHIEGQGSISLETQYSYADSLVEVGSVYGYRLADVSYNGDVTYHDVIYVEVQAPSEFVLFKNYPNPFNPSTTIKYNLPVESRVELKIYSVLGQEIITLVDDMEKAGYHQMQWNGTTRYGQSVASGMYILAFRAKGSGGKEHTKMMKILLIK